MICIHFESQAARSSEMFTDMLANHIDGNLVVQPRYNDISIAC